MIGNKFIIHKYVRHYFDMLVTCHESGLIYSWEIVITMYWKQDYIIYYCQFIVYYCKQSVNCRVFCFLFIQGFFFISHSNIIADTTRQFSILTKDIKPYTYT